MITLLAAAVVGVGTWAMSVLEPHLRWMDVLFEVTSAFGTVGLSTGITPELSTASKFLSILVMYIRAAGASDGCDALVFWPGRTGSLSGRRIAIG